MMLSSVSVPLVGLVGTGVLGHLDDKVYLAAVAAAVQVFNVLFIGCNFLRMGTTGITAQAHGSLYAGSAGRTPDGSEALRRALCQPALLALAIGALIILLQAPIRELAFAIIGGGSEVTRFGRQYFDIRVWSAPAALLNYVAIGWLLGMQNARGPLVITLVINLGNVVLDLWFVLGLGFKVRGVATAALLAELSGTAVAWWLVRQELSRYADGRAGIGPAIRAALRPGRRLLDSRARHGLLAVNGNLFLRTLSLMFTFMFMTAQGARLGTVILAANALLLNFLWLTSYALDGIANAAEALVGKAVGAHDRAGMQRAVNRTLAWSLGFGCAFTALFWAGGPAIVRLLTSLRDVQSAAFEYLPWLVALPMIAVWSFFYDGVYVGATLSREMRVVMSSAAFLVFVPVWYLARGMGNHGLWLAFMAFMTVRGLAMHLWFNRLKEHVADAQTP